MVTHFKDLEMCERILGFDRVYLNEVCIGVAIQSFSDKSTKDFFFNTNKANKVRKGIKWRNLDKVVKRKLDMLHYATCLDDLKSPPKNFLEALKGDLSGFYSIRVNDQWRVVFRWTKDGPKEVRILDYHK